MAVVFGIGVLCEGAKRFTSGELNSENKEQGQFKWHDIGICLSVVVVLMRHATINVDIFACIHFHRIMKIDNFACIRIHVSGITGSLVY